MPCFLKNLPPLGYTFYLRAAMIIVPQTQYFCILCTQKPRERILNCAPKLGRIKY